MLRDGSKNLLGLLFFSGKQANFALAFFFFFFRWCEPIIANRSICKGVFKSTQSHVCYSRLNLMGWSVERTSDVSFETSGIFCPCHHCKYTIAKILRYPGIKFSWFKNVLLILLKLKHSLLFWLTLPLVYPLKNTMINTSTGREELNALENFVSFSAKLDGKIILSSLLTANLGFVILSSCA